MLEDNGHEVIPFSIHSNKNVKTEYSKYFVEPIGSRDATYFEECKKTPKVIWQMLTRSIYSTEVEKAIKKEIKDVKPDLVYIIHFVNKLSPSVICGAKKMGVPVVLRLSDYFLLCPRFDFMYNKKPCEECLTKGYRTCIKKRCVKGSLFASVVRVFSMKVHKAMNVYKGVDAPKPEMLSRAMAKMEEANAQLASVSDWTCSLDDLMAKPYPSSDSQNVRMSRKYLSMEFFMKHIGLPETLIFTIK